MISTESRPRLASKARLRFDRKSARYMLLYPERGLVLNPTAADVLQRCDGARTVRLHRGGAGAAVRPPKSPSVEREVVTFLQTMADRGLVQAAA